MIKEKFTFKSYEELFAGLDRHFDTAGYNSDLAQYILLKEILKQLIKLNNLTHKGGNLK